MSLVHRKLIFIKKAMLLHCFKYDYNKCKYKNAHTDVIIRCPIHGEFTQAPKNHITGSGCPVCAYKYKRYGKLPYIKPKLIGCDIFSYRSKCA